MGRIERLFGEQFEGDCPLCRGGIMAEVYVAYERIPGAGFRETGERYLSHESEGLVTDDFRCVRCGRKTAALTTMVVPGIEDILARLDPNWRIGRRQ